MQDWATNLEHLQSILIEFDANCISKKDQLAYTFYDGLRPLIKLWVTKKRQQQKSWVKLVSDANQAKAKAHIIDNDHLNHQYLKGKQPLKIIFNS